MSVFETVKENVSLRETVERHGIDVNRYGMAVCPFHNDHHPSLYVGDDHYHCFSCGAHGDVIDFVAELEKLSLYDAALLLMAEYRLDPSLPPSSEVLYKRDIAAQLKRQKAHEEDCFRLLNNYMWKLKCWKKDHAPATPEEPVDPHFIEACQQLPYVEYLTEAWLLDSTEARYEIASSRYFRFVEQRMKQIVLEEKRNDE